MKDFKVNERVVCIGEFSTNGRGNAPSIGETVTIKDFYIDEDDNNGEVYLDLFEYYYDYDGNVQCFIIDKFDKLKPQSLKFDTKKLTSSGVNTNNTNI